MSEVKTTIENRTKNTENSTTTEKLETFDNKIIVTSLLEDLLSEVKTTNENRTKNIESSTTTENNKILRPAKLKFKPEKKQSNITKFFQQTETKTQPKLLPTKTTKQQTKKTTTDNKKQKNDAITKTTEKRKGYWTQLALKKKQQDQENTNIKQQNAKNKLQQEDTTNNKVNTEITMQVPQVATLNSEAFPKHSNLADDVTGDARNLESSNPNLANKPERNKSENRLLGNHQPELGLK